MAQNDNTVHRQPLYFGRGQARWRHDAVIRDESVHITPLVFFPDLHIISITWHHNKAKDHFYMFLIDIIKNVDHNYYDKHTQYLGKSSCTPDSQIHMYMFFSGCEVVPSLNKFTYILR